MNTLIVFLISLTVLATLFCFRKRKRAVLLIQKIAVVVLIALVTANSFFNDSILDLLNGGWRDGAYITTSDHVQIALRSLQAVSYIILPVAIFGKGRFYKNAAVFFCLPVAVAWAFYFPQTMNYYLTVSTESTAYVAPAGVRYAFLTAELVLTITLPACVILFQKHSPKFLSFELFCMLLALPVLTLIQFAPYAPRAIWGVVQTSLPQVQLEWILSTVVFIVVLIVLFRFKNRQTRLEICWLFTLALFLNYNNTFLLGFTVKRIPFQLCNMASYFMLIAMITRSSKFFHFVFLANVAGTIVAMLAPEAAENTITSFHAVRYIYQHSLVLIAPCIAMGLRIFPRLNARSMAYAAAGFSLYWVFCMVFGGYVNAHPETFGATVNPFYLFDAQIMGRVAPWMSKMITPRVFFGMTFMPFAQVFVLIAFYGLTCLLFLVVSGIYKFTDDHLILRAKLIEIIEKKTGRKLRLPLKFID